MYTGVLLGTARCESPEQSSISLTSECCPQGAFQSTWKHSTFSMDPCVVHNGLSGRSAIQHEPWDNSTVKLSDAQMVKVQSKPVYDRRSAPEHPSQQAAARRIPAIPTQEHTARLVSKVSNIFKDQATKDQYQANMQEWFHTHPCPAGPQLSPESASTYLQQVSEASTAIGLGGIKWKYKR